MSLGAISFVKLRTHPEIYRTISQYLDISSVRETLGVDPVVDRPYTSCSDDVGRAFGESMDFFFPTPTQIAALLERGVRVLIYVGANDWICNWVCSFS